MTERESQTANGLFPETAQEQQDEAIAKALAKGVKPNKQALLQALEERSGSSRFDDLNGAFDPIKSAAERHSLTEEQVEQELRNFGF